MWGARMRWWERCGGRVIRRRELAEWRKALRGLCFADRDRGGALPAIAAVGTIPGKRGGERVAAGVASRIGGGVGAHGAGSHSRAGENGRTYGRKPADRGRSSGGERSA